MKRNQLFLAIRWALYGLLALLLAGCTSGPVSGRVIKAAQKLCEPNGGLHTVWVDWSAPSHFEARCENGVVIKSKVTVIYP